MSMEGCCRAAPGKEGAQPRPAGQPAAQQRHWGPWQRRAGPELAQPVAAGHYRHGLLPARWSTRPEGLRCEEGERSPDRVDWRRTGEGQGRRR